MAWFRGLVVTTGWAFCCFAAGVTTSADRANSKSGHGLSTLGVTATLLKDAGRNTAVAAGGFAASAFAAEHVAAADVTTRRLARFDATQPLVQSDREENSS